MLRTKTARSTSYSGMYERQKEWADKIEKKREEERVSKANQNDDNCTFRPQINQRLHR
jgi:hypothetical protein